MTGRWAVAAVSVVVTAFSLGGSAAAGTVGVSVGNYYFEDATVGDGKVTARVGDQLSFTVVEGAGHTVSVDALGIDSGQLPIGATFVTPVLGVPGNYTLYCRSHINRNHITTLVVVGSTAASTTAPPVTVAPATTVAGATTVPGAVSPGVTPGSDAGAIVIAPEGGAPAVTAVGGSNPDFTDLADELLPVGVVAPDGTPWLRSVWVALGALVVMVGAVTAAVRAGERHHRESLRID